PVAADERADRLERALPAELAHDLGERSEGAALAVGEATALQHAAPLAERVGERAREVRLADPGWAEHGDERGGALAPGRLVGLAERRELLFAADGRR